MATAASTAHVRELAAAQVPLEQIEAYIEEQVELDDEERSVLWLAAWCYTGGMDGFGELAHHLGRPSEQPCQA